MEEDETNSYNDQQIGIMPWWNRARTMPIIFFHMAWHCGFEELAQENLFVCFAEDPFTLPKSSHIVSFERFTRITFCGNNLFLIRNAHTAPIYRTPTSHFGNSPNSLQVFRKACHVTQHLIEPHFDFSRHGKWHAQRDSTHTCVYPLFYAFRHSIQNRRFSRVGNALMRMDID